MLLKVFFYSLSFSLFAASMEKMPPSFEILPKPIKKYVLSFLNEKDLGRVMCVSKSMAKLFEGEQGAKLFFPHHQGIKSYEKLLTLVRILYNHNDLVDFIYKDRAKWVEDIQDIYTLNKASEIATLLFGCDQDNAGSDFQYTHTLEEATQNIVYDLKLGAGFLSWKAKEITKKGLNQLILNRVGYPMPTAVYVPSEKPPFLLNKANKLVQFYIKLEGFNNAFWCKITDAAENKVGMFSLCNEQLRCDFLKQKSRSIETFFEDTGIVPGIVTENIKSRYLIKQLPCWKFYGLPSVYLPLTKYEKKFNFYQIAHKTIKENKFQRLRKELEEKTKDNDIIMWKLSAAAGWAIYLKNMDASIYRLPGHEILYGFTITTAKDFLNQHEGHPIIRFQQWLLKKTNDMKHTRALFIKILFDL